MLFSLFKPEFQSGATPDNRPREDRDKDFRFEEIVASANPVNWKEKSPSEWRKFPIFDQNGSGSCVAQTGAKILGINYFLKNKDYVHFSATDIYQRRSNKPSGGMIAVDAFSILTKGVTLEELARSQKLTDAQMDSFVVEGYKRKVGDIFKISNYVSLPIRDMETVASTIQTTGKGVMVWFYFTRDEWTNTPTIKDKNLSIHGSKTVRHSVTAVDFAIYKGKKGIIIEDSWGANTAMGGQRFISEEFFNARNFYTGYALNFTFEEGVVDPNKPRYHFLNDLQFTNTVSYGNPDIIALQNCLKWLGFFPKNTDSTGYYGAITKKGVQQFQASKGLVQDGVFGKNTREEFNRIFA